MSSELHPTHLGRLIARVLRRLPDAVLRDWNDGDYHIFGDQYSDPHLMVVSLHDLADLFEAGDIPANVLIDWGDAEAPEAEVPSREGPSPLRFSAAELEQLSKGVDFFRQKVFGQ